MSVKFYFLCSFFQAAVFLVIFLLLLEVLSLNSFVFVQKILQRTPIRVLHRRSPLEREKIIHWLEAFRLVA